MIDQYLCLKQRFKVNCRQGVMKMRYSSLILLCCLWFFSCKKTVQEKSAFQNNAVITGLDVRLCPNVINCPVVCGGILFHFTDTTYTANIPVDNASTFKLNAD